MQTGKREHLSKYLQTKLDEEKRDRQDKALAKANSPPKMAETAAPKLIVTTISISISATAMASAQETGKENEQQKRKEK